MANPNFNVYNEFWKVCPAIVGLIIGILQWAERVLPNEEHIKSEISFLRCVLFTSKVESLRKLFNSSTPMSGILSISGKDPYEDYIRVNGINNEHEIDILKIECRLLCSRGICTWIPLPQVIIIVAGVISNSNIIKNCLLATSILLLVIQIFACIIGWCAKSGLWKMKKSSQFISGGKQ